MNRKVLLIEPNYKNKYPPMGLMKIATYFRRCDDDVRFFKGDLKDFAEDYCAKNSTRKIQKPVWQNTSQASLPLFVQESILILKPFLTSG